jgi:putative heme transporter
VKIHSEVGRSWPWLILETVAILALAITALLAKSTIAQSLAAAIHADGYWVAVTFAFELISIMTFARTQRVVLRSIGGYISIPSMAATAMIGNAISFTLPLIGPGAGTAFTFRRFVRFGSDPAAAVWALGAAWLLSSIAWSLLLIAGALISGNVVASLAGAVISTATVLASIIVLVALRRYPRLQKLAGVISSRLARQFARIRGRPDQGVTNADTDTLGRFVSFHMSRSRWTQASALALISWVSGAACLVAAILALRTTVPYREVFLIYCAGATAGSFNVTPGGLGVVEGTLVAGLVAAGLSSKSALGSVLIFRTATFWIPMALGWCLFGLVDRCASDRPRAHRIEGPSTGGNHTATR